MSSKETFRKAFMEKGKKGQVTIFIIVGILIVIIVGGLLFVNRNNINFRGTTSVQVEPVREYIRECVQNGMEIELELIRRWGGRHDLNLLYPDNQQERDINVLVDHNYEDLSLSMSIIEENIAQNLKQYLIDNCELESVFRSSFNLEQIGDIEVNVDIYDDIPEIRSHSDSIIVLVNYPLIIKKGDSEINLDKFEVEIKNNFARIYYVTSLILAEYTNSENPITDISYFCRQYQGITCDQFSYNENWWRIEVVDENGKVFRFLIRKR